MRAQVDRGSASWGHGRPSVVGLVVVSLAACTLANPNYDPDGEASTSAASLTITASITATTSGQASATTSASDSSASGSTSADATTGATTGATTTGDAGTDGSSSGLPCDGPPLLLYGDMDGDGYGDPNLPIEACAGDEPAGAVANGDDCDDSRDDVHPGAVELCDGIDNDCNDLRDESSAANSECGLFGGICYLKAYGDHFYYACTRNKLPTDVNHDCMELVTGPGATAYHVKITDNVENAAVMMIATLLPVNPSIGLRDANGFDQMNDHKWKADGSTLSGFGSERGAFPWAEKEPNEPASRWIVIDKGSMHWVDAVELFERPFICEAELVP